MKFGLLFEIQPRRPWGPTTVADICDALRRFGAEVMPRFAS